jgi:hypothetical protein
MKRRKRIRSRIIIKQVMLHIYHHIESSNKKKTEITPGNKFLSLKPDKEEIKSPIKKKIMIDK